MNDNVSMLVDAMDNEGMVEITVISDGTVTEAVFVDFFELDECMAQAVDYVVDRDENSD